MIALPILFLQAGVFPRKSTPQFLVCQPMCPLILGKTRATSTSSIMLVPSVNQYQGKSALIFLILFID